MKLRIAEWIALAIVVLSFVLGIMFHGRMPAQMASHWNVGNEVDGYMSRFWGLFFAPILLAGLFLLFLAIPRTDPLKHNIETFRSVFDGFILLLFLFLVYLYLLTIAWNLGRRFVMIRFLAPGFAVLFFFAGVLLERAKRNMFIGIRTPWTLASDRVWEKTHRLGGTLFKIAGVLSLGGIVFPSYAIYFVLMPVLLAAVIATAYSYREHLKESREGASSR
jgi:uncharacterized membrane protein